MGRLSWRTAPAHIRDPDARDVQQHRSLMRLAYGRFRDIQPLPQIDAPIRAPDGQVPADDPIDSTDRLEVAVEHQPALLDLRQVEFALGRRQAPNLNQHIPQCIGASPPIGHRLLQSFAGATVCRRVSLPLRRVPEKRATNSSGSREGWQVHERGGRVARGGGQPCHGGDPCGRVQWTAVPSSVPITNVTAAAAPPRPI